MNYKNNNDNCFRRTLTLKVMLSVLLITKTASRTRQHNYEFNGVWVNRTDAAWRHLPLAWQWKNLIEINAYDQRTAISGTANAPPYDPRRDEIEIPQQTTKLILVVGNTNNEIRYYIAMHKKSKKLDSYCEKSQQSIFIL